jgi:hypothetical protein
VTAPADVATLRRLLADATPAPWSAGHWGEEYWVQSDDADADVGENMHEPDAALIVALRNATPRLLDRLEALEALARDVANTSPLEFVGCGETPRCFYCGALGHDGEPAHHGDCTLPRARALLSAGAAGGEVE